MTVLHKKKKLITLIFLILYILNVNRICGEQKGSYLEGTGEVEVGDFCTLWCFNAFVLHHSKT